MKWKAVQSLEVTLEHRAIARPDVNLRFSQVEVRRHRCHARGHPTNRPKTTMTIFDEKYRVVGIADDRLTVRGVLSGEVLTIVNPQSEFPLSQEEYPVGKLIALSDPSSTLPN